MTTVKVERTLDQSAASSVKNRSEKAAGAQGDIGYNLQSTRALLSILASGQGQVAERLNHTILNLNRNLSTLVKGQSMAANESMYGRTLAYLKLTQSLGKSDPKVQETLARGLSSSTRFIRAADAYQSYKDNFDKLPAILKLSETGTYLSKTILQSLADLSSVKKIGAGLMRDLNLHQISLSAATTGQKLAAARTLKAALSYIQSNQPEILLKEAQKQAQEKQAAKSATTAQSSQNSSQSTVKSSTSDGWQTYLDIFKKNAKAQSELVPDPSLEKIRTLVQKAADIAKSGNLYPQSSSQTTLGTTSAAKSDDNGASASKTSLKETAQNISRQSDAQGSKLSLSELSARAAKLQMQFTRERQRLIREGKLPDPAKLPDYYEQELRQLEKEGQRPAQKEARASEEIFTIPRRVYQSPLLQRSVQSLGTNLPAAASQSSSNETAAALAQPKTQEQSTTSENLNAQSTPAASSTGQAEIEQAKAQIAELKNELLQFQKEAIAAAKEAVSVQLETQKQLQAQVKIWYQTLQDAGQIAGNTLAQLKEQNAKAQALLQQGAAMNAQGTGNQTAIASDAAAPKQEQSKTEGQATQTPAQEEAPAQTDKQSNAQGAVDKSDASSNTQTAQPQAATASPAIDMSFGFSTVIGPEESSINYSKQTVDAQGRTMAGFYQYVNIDRQTPGQTQDKTIASKDAPAQENAPASLDAREGDKGGSATAQEEAAPAPAQDPQESARAEAAPAQDEPEAVQVQSAPQEESITQASNAQTAAQAPADEEVQQTKAQDQKSDLSRLYQEQLIKEGQMQAEAAAAAKVTGEPDLLQMPPILNQAGVQGTPIQAAMSPAAAPSVASELDFTVQRPTQSNVLIDESFDENFNFSKLYQEVGAKASQPGANPALDAKTIMQVRPSDELEDEDTLQLAKNININHGQGQASALQVSAAAAAPQGNNPNKQEESKNQDASKNGLLKRLASFFH